MSKILSLCIICISLAGCASLEKISTSANALGSNIIDRVDVLDDGQIKVVLKPEYEALRRISEFYLGDKSK